MHVPACEAENSRGLRIRRCMVAVKKWALQVHGRSKGRAKWRDRKIGNEGLKKTREAKACLGRKDQRGETVTFLAVCSQPCSGNSCLDTQRLIPSFISMGNKAGIPQIIKAEMWTKRTTALLCNIRKRWVEYTHFQNAEMSWQDRPRARKEMASWLPMGGLFVSLFCKYFGYLHEDKESFGSPGVGYWKYKTL